ncbi:MAG: hypothetical protein WBM72_09675 [Actinomycetota bacterium]
MDLLAALQHIEGIEVDDIDVLADENSGPARPPLQDLRMRYGTISIRLVVKVEEAPDARGIPERAEALKLRGPTGAIPVVAAPYIGPALRRRLEQFDIGWLDSLGNIHVQRNRPALLLHIEARGTRASLPRFRGRLFSPAHSRVARALLERPDATHRLKALAVLAETDVSSVSRAMKVFGEAKLVERRPDGWRLPDPAAMLDAWLDRALSQPVTRPERWFICPDTPGLMGRLAAGAREHGIRLAFTGLRAAPSADVGPGALHAPIEAYVSPFDRLVRLNEIVGEPTETRSDGTLRMMASPRGGAFVGVDQEVPSPVVGRMQLLTDLYRSGREAEAVAMRLRREWGL